MVALPLLEEARGIRPARPVIVKTALVASQPLPFGVLRKLGLDEARIVRPTARMVDLGLGHMGNRVELCRDDWRDDLAELPEVGSLGQGHEVLRGHGAGARFAGWSVSPAWNEALWPGRRRIASWTNAIAIRPWVELLE